MSSIRRIPMSRRQFVKGAGVVAMGFGLGGGVFGAGCSPSGGLESDAATGEGEAFATLPGFNGDVTVSLKVDESSGEVLEVAIDGPFETANRGGVAVEKMQLAMNEAGSIDVDTVSGATITSVAILDAANYAYALATGTLGEGYAMVPWLKRAAYESGGSKTMIKRTLDMGAGTCNPSVPPSSHLAGFPLDLIGFGIPEGDFAS